MREDYSKLFNIKEVSKKEAKRIGDRLGLDWNIIDLEQFRMGLEVEQEHSDMVGNNMHEVGRIAVVHILEVPDYYTKLRKYVDSQ